MLYYCTAVYTTATVALSQESRAARVSSAAAVLCLLIKAGIDLRAVNAAGKTAAQVAAACGNTLAAALLTRAAVGL
jgi:ankyrin repeat protein